MNDTRTLIVILPSEVNKFFNTLDSFIPVIKEIGALPKELDILIAEILPKGTFGGFTEVDAPRPISSYCGEEQAKRIAEKWDGESKEFYPWIPLDHPAGQFCMTLVEVIDPWHGPKSITWGARDEKTGITVEMEAEKQYPGIRAKVEKLLALQGIEA